MSKDTGRTAPKCAPRVHERLEDLTDSRLLGLELDA
jgi:hypothetical protein